MSNHSNAVPGQYPEFAGLVQHKLWPAVKGRLQEKDFKALISKPEEVMLSLRGAFTKKHENDLVVSASPFFANEEVKSNYGYPQGYAVKPVCEQLIELSKHFSALDTGLVLAYSKELPALPASAEGWFAVPKFEVFAKTYNEAVGKVFDLIAKTRGFFNYREGELGPKHLRLSERTAAALQMLGKKQNGDFLLIPAQFGLTHRGRSTRRVCEIISNSPQFGLGSFVIGCMLLSHPERLVQWEQLHIDCPGDEYSPGADDDFSRAPSFRFYGSEVRFDAFRVGHAYESYGSASAFLPQ